MIYIIISTEELMDFIRDHPFAIIEFKTTWCINCSRIAPHYQNFSAKYTNIKFGNIDIEYVGQEKLDKLDINLNLGAIPSFYIYKNGMLIDKLISGSQSRLESFIDSNYFGEVSKISSVFNPGLNSKNLKMILPPEDDEKNKQQIKCSKCSQYNHKSKDCYLEVDKPASEKSKKEYKILCSQCNKMHPAWELKCMKPVKEKTVLSPKSDAIITKDKKQLTSAFPFDETPKIFITRSPQKSLINSENITGEYGNSNLQAVRNEQISTGLKLDDSKNDKKHVHWNLVPFVNEIKQQENDVVKELMEKLAKLEGINKKRENAYLTVKKQKEIINFLKDKVEKLADENNHLKRSKSADIYKDSK